MISDFSYFGRMLRDEIGLFPYLNMPVELRQSIYAAFRKAMEKGFEDARSLSDPVTIMNYKITFSNTSFDIDGNIKFPTLDSYKKHLDVQTTRKISFE